MKYFLFLILFLWVSSLKAQSVSGTIKSNGVTRSYRLYIPASYTGAAAVPLLLNFHGYGSNSMEQEAYGDFRKIADTANFLIVHPQGTGNPAGWMNFGSVASAGNDIQFVSNLIDSLKVKYNIDLERVYSTGMSNGGFMSYDLACFLSKRIAAVASVTGSMISTHKSACNPGRALPVMQIHGTADQTVSYNGAGGIISSVHIDSLVKFWVKQNQCDPQPVMEALPNTSAADSCIAELYTYSGALKENKVVFYKVIKGGHTWPGSAYDNASGFTNKDFDASLQIWLFMRQYRLTKAMNVDDLKFKNEAPSIYPNPSHGYLHIENKDHKQLRLLLYNSLGEKVVEQDLSENPSIHIANQQGVFFYCIYSREQLLKSGKVLFIR